MHSAIRLRPKTQNNHLFVPKIQVKFKQSTEDFVMNDEIQGYSEKLHQKRIDDDDENFLENTTTGFRLPRSPSKLANLQKHSMLIKIPEITESFPENISENASKAYQLLNFDEKVDVLSDILTSVRKANEDITNDNLANQNTFTSTLEAIVSHFKVYDFSKISENYQNFGDFGGRIQSKNSNYQETEIEKPKQESNTIREIQQKLPTEPEIWAGENFVPDRYNGPFSRAAQARAIAQLQQDHQDKISEEIIKENLNHDNLSDLQALATNIPILQKMKEKDTILVKSNNTGYQAKPTTPAALTDLLFISNKPRDDSDVRNQNIKLQTNQNKYKNQFLPGKNATQLKMPLSKKNQLQSSIDNNYSKISTNNPVSLSFPNHMTLDKKQASNFNMNRVAENTPITLISSNSGNKASFRSPMKKQKKINKLKPFALDPNINVQPTNYQQMIGDREKSNVHLLKRQNSNSVPQNQNPQKNKKGKVPEILQKILTSFAYVACMVGPDGKILNVGPDDLPVIDVKNPEDQDKVDSKLQKAPSFARLGYSNTHLKKEGDIARPNSSVENSPSENATSNLKTKKLNEILEKRRQKLSSLSKNSKFSSSTHPSNIPLTESELSAQLIKSYAEEIIDRKGHGNDLFSDIAVGTVLMDNTENLDLLQKQALEKAKNSLTPSSIYSAHEKPTAILPSLGGLKTQGQDGGDRAVRMNYSDDRNQKRLGKNSDFSGLKSGSKKNKKKKKRKKVFDENGNSISIQEEVDEEDASEYSSSEEGQDFSKVRYITGGESGNTKSRKHRKNRQSTAKFKDGNDNFSDSISAIDSQTTSRNTSSLDVTTKKSQRKARKLKIAALNDQNEQKKGKIYATMDNIDFTNQDNVKKYFPDVENINDIEIKYEYVDAKDEDGNVILDDNGNPVQIKKQVAYQIARDEDGNIILADDGQPLKIKAKSKILNTQQKSGPRHLRSERGRNKRAENETNSHSIYDPENKSGEFSSATLVDEDGNTCYESEYDENGLRVMVKQRSKKQRKATKARHQVGDSGIERSEENSNSYGFSEYDSSIG